MGLIYSATFPNGKKYIGQTTATLKDRKREHEYWAKNQLDDFVFHKAIRKYGSDSIVWEVLEDNIIDKEKLNEREIYWINEKDSYYGDGKGYNMTRGGGGLDDYSFLRIFDEKSSMEVFETFKELKNIDDTAAYYHCSQTAIKNALNLTGEDWHQYTYHGRGEKRKFDDSFRQAVLNRYIETGSLYTVSDEFKLNNSTTQRILQQLCPNYIELYKWDCSVDKETALKICEDFKKVGQLKIVGDKYVVSTGVVRGILKKLLPNYRDFLVPHNKKRT